MRRREEARRAGEFIGADYRTWDFPDGSLQPDLAVRAAVINEMRSFQPDLVLTHRPNDYHPDHRSVGQAVQDASYMVTVPYVCPEQPAMRRDPVVAYMCDLFTRPNPLRADVLLDVRDEFESVVQMAACHQSQFFEWLPYHAGKLSEVPELPQDRLLMLRTWMLGLMEQRCMHFKEALSNVSSTAVNPTAIEVFEVSEYAAPIGPRDRQRLFPGCLSPE
jgi:N-acetylglucosamine malate deacetylase 1